MEKKNPKTKQNKIPKTKQTRNIECSGAYEHPGPWFGLCPFPAENPMLGWAQTLNSLLRQVQRFSGLELGSKLLPKITYIYIFSLCPPRP